jgi:hypothetical protein
VEGLTVTDGTAFDTADEIVAKRILARFMATRLLPQQYADSTQAQLAAGKMRAEDWRLLAENALEVEKRQQSEK